MSDETYYTVLNIPETAALSEIKTAYRELIKQVHPDTISNLAPYLRRIAEEKAKEITEAYSVLSSSSNRREYDRQLAEYRRQSTPQAPPAPPTTPPAQQAASQTSSMPYCNWCGVPLYASGGFCPKCNKFNAPAGSPQQPTAVRWLGYKFGRWFGEHPILALAIPVFLLIAVLVSQSNTSPQAPAEPTQSASATKAVAPATTDPSNCLPSQRVLINGRFVCQAPAQATQPASVGKAKPTVRPPIESFDRPVEAATEANTVASEEPASTQPAVSVSGTYVGTIHNQTANLSSSFGVVLHQTKSGLLQGCMEVKQPLYGSGVLRGSIRRAHLNFVVADITFQGDASNDEIVGSYVVFRQDGNQLGTFTLWKPQAVEASYGCVNGVLTEVATASSSSQSSQPNGVSHEYKVLPPAAKPHSPLHAVVIEGYRSILYKRCAFLPSDKIFPCGIGSSEQVARLRGGDRVTVLSPLTRAENGQDIYKVRTEQGWVGWIDAQAVTLDPQ